MHHFAAFMKFLEKVHGAAIVFQIQKDYYVVNYFYGQMYLWDIRRIRIAFGQYEGGKKRYHDEQI